MADLQNTINHAKSEFLQAKNRIAHALETTPDDRINWSPSPSARTPIQQVAHAARSIFHIHEMLDGRPFGIKTTLEADEAFLEWERQFSTREEVLALLEQNSAAYVAWLNALTPERLESMAVLPFNLGTAPVSAVLAAAPAHTNWHAAQIEYIQTIYADRDWLMGT